MHLDQPQQKSKNTLFQRAKSKLRMKKLLVFSCLTVFIFSLVGTAGAFLITDSYEPGTNVYLRGDSLGKMTSTDGHSI